MTKARKKRYKFSSFLTALYSKYPTSIVKGPVKYIAGSPEYLNIPYANPR